MKYLIIHCSDTPNGKHYTAKDIDSWHHDRGFRRTTAISTTFNPSLQHIGYQFVINVDGSVETGRAVGEPGAHCSGLNTNSIGICMIGKNMFTIIQWESLTTIVKALQKQFDNNLIVMSHYQADSAKEQGKTCPNFNAKEWYDKGMGQCGGHTIA